VQRIAEPRHGSERPEVGDDDADKRDQDPFPGPERGEDDQRQDHRSQRGDSRQIRDQQNVVFAKEAAGALVERSLLLPGAQRSVHR
jgi:hypothetical protein